MSIKNCCSLCCTSCSEYKLLQNEMGESTRFYEVTVKYFDPMLIMEEGHLSNEKNQKVLCQECWTNIESFHEFQENLLKTRMLWEDKANLKSLRIEVKQEDEQPYDSINYLDKEHFNKSDSEESEIEEDDLSNDDLDDYDLKKESLSSCEDTEESVTKIDKDDILHEDSTVKEEENIQNKPELHQKKRRGRKHKNIADKCKDVHDDSLGNPTKDKGNSALNMIKARESDALLAEWKPELICDLCSESAPNFDKLRIHFKENHLKTRFYVKCCERKFFRRCVLVNHIELHLNPEAHKCDICGKSSTTKHNLKLHKKVMHQDTKQLKCDICEKLFKQKVTLERHLLTHATGNKDFVCSECGKGYVAERLLKLHIKHVHNVDRVCDQCGKTIHGIQALKKHLMEHAGIERPKFRCDACGLELKSANGLKRHKAAFHNDGTTIYVCGVCGKVAASENALWNHKKLVHLQERKHKCNYCEKAFKRPKSLREHIATHTGQDLYQCPHCPQTFKVSANMHHHRKKVHPIEWEEARKHRREIPKININQVKKQVVL